MPYPIRPSLHIKQTKLKKQRVRPGKMDRTKKTRTGLTTWTSLTMRLDAITGQVCSYGAALFCPRQNAFPK
jgi:hypothetical protein